MVVSGRKLSISTWRKWGVSSKERILSRQQPIFAVLSRAGSEVLQYMNMMKFSHCPEQVRCSIGFETIKNPEKLELNPHSICVEDINYMAWSSSLILIYMIYLIWLLNGNGQSGYLQQGICKWNLPSRVEGWGHHPKSARHCSCSPDRQRQIHWNPNILWCFFLGWKKSRWCSWLHIHDSYYIW